MVTKILVHVDYWVKIWILICLFSLLAWTIYWVPSGIYRFFDFNGNSWDVVIQNRGLIFAVMELSAAAGMLVSFVGLIFGIVALSEFWPKNVWNRNKSILNAKKWVVSALALEGFYFALLLPSGLRMVGFGRDGPLRFSLLGIDYLLMVFFTLPFLTISAIKIFKLKDNNDSFRAWIWVGLTFVGYIASLWVNNTLKWIDIVFREGFGSLFIGFISLGALNSLILMSLALFCAIIGAIFLGKKDFGSAAKWAAITLILVGVHYSIYIVYSFLVGMENFLMLAEIWTIPLLGLGLTMLKTRIARL